eukprot:tig00000142_g8638.t1
MGKKKRQKQQKPWCYYCDRLFDDEKVLLLHQKAKHFKCNECHKKLTSIAGLVIHCAQMHKITLSKVPQAREGRDDAPPKGPNVAGMEGIPEDCLGPDGDGGGKRQRADDSDDDSGPAIPAALPGISLLPPGTGGAGFVHTPASMPAGSMSMANPYMPQIPGMAGSMPSFPGMGPPYGMGIYQSLQGMQGMPPPPPPPPMGGYPGFPPGMSPPPQPPSYGVPPGMPGYGFPGAPPMPMPPQPAYPGTPPRRKKMIFDDEEFSPEEKRAAQERYKVEN